MLWAVYSYPSTPPPFGQLELELEHGKAILDTDDVAVKARIRFHSRVVTCTGRAANNFPT